MKRDRQKAILDIVSKFPVRTHDELMSRLKEAGFSVAQSTISRDIKELKLAKTPSELGGYIYSLPTETEPEEVHSDIFSSALISAEYASNCVVVKTRPGTAPAFGAEVDRGIFPEILGCIAGDDTVLIIAKTEDDAAGLCKNISSVLKAKGKQYAD